MTLVTPDVRAPCHSWPLAFEADMTGHAFQSAIADGISDLWLAAISVVGSSCRIADSRHIT